MKGPLAAIHRSLKNLQNVMKQAPSSREQRAYLAFWRDELLPEIKAINSFFKLKKESSSDPEDPTPDTPAYQHVFLECIHLVGVLQNKYHLHILDGSLSDMLRAILYILQSADVSLDFVGLLDSLRILTDTREEKINSKIDDLPFDMIEEIHKNIIGMRGNRSAHVFDQALRHLADLSFQCREGFLHSTLVPLFVEYLSSFSEREFSYTLYNFARIGLKWKSIPLQAQKLILNAMRDKLNESMSATEFGCFLWALVVMEASWEDVGDIQADIEYMLRRYQNYFDHISLTQLQQVKLLGYPVAFNCLTALPPDQVSNFEKKVHPTLLSHLRSFAKNFELRTHQSISGVLLPDFALYQDGELLCVIECDGPTHFYRGTRMINPSTQLRNRIYAQLKIPCIVIPYWEKNIQKVIAESLMTYLGEPAVTMLKRKKTLQKSNEFKKSTIEAPDFVPTAFNVEAPEFTPTTFNVEAPEFTPTTFNVEAPDFVPTAFNVETPELSPKPHVGGPVFDSTAPILNAFYPNCIPSFSEGVSLQDNQSASRFRGRLL